MNRGPSSSISVVILSLVILAALYSGLVASIGLLQLFEKYEYDPPNCFLMGNSSWPGSSCTSSSWSSWPWDPGRQETASTALNPWMDHKQKNKAVHILNGNRDRKGIRLAHWNPGSAYLPNKMTELELAVAEHQPHLLGISEANFKTVHDSEDVQIADYELFFSKTLKNPDLGISRVVCYKHSSLVGSLRHDLMSDNFSSIWMELGLPRKRKFLVCQLYREWQYIGQPDNSSRTIPVQLERWLLFLNQWERALDSGKEVIVMGDCNLDFFKFDNAGQLQPLVDLVVGRLYPHGVQQIVTQPTHSWPGQQDTCIDHIYTNTPDKLSCAQVYIRGGSDHRFLTATKISKSIKENIRYCKKRSYKEFNEEAFLKEVEKIRWWGVYSTNDVDSAVDIFTNKITEILDRMAPVKKFQTRTKYAAWVGKSTKQKMKERDRAHQAAIQSKSVEDWARYKKMRNNITKILHKEKESWQQGKLKSCDENTDLEECAWVA